MGGHVVEALKADGRCTHVVYELPGDLDPKGGALERTVISQAKLPYTIVRPGHRLEAWQDEATGSKMGITVKESGSGQGEITVPVPSAASNGGSVLPFFACADTSAVPFVAGDDVGGVVAAVLNNPKKYVAMKEVAAVSQVCPRPTSAPHTQCPRPHSPLWICSLL